MLRDDRCVTETTQGSISQLGNVKKRTPRKTKNTSPSGSEISQMLRSRAQCGASQRKLLHTADSPSAHLWMCDLNETNQAASTCLHCPH